MPGLAPMMNMPGMQTMSYMSAAGMPPVGQVQPRGRGQGHTRGRASSSGEGNPPRRARKTSASALPAGQMTYGTLPLWDKMTLLEKCERTDFNKIALDGRPEHMITAALLMAVGKGYHDKVPDSDRHACEESVLGRYKQLNEPLKGLTLEKAYAKWAQQNSASTTGVAYSIHVDTSSNRQYIWNGVVSRFLDG
eukprot:5703459-Pyramimonas_sp.AAC.1